jgi:hypothetical protein
VIDGNAAEPGTDEGRVQIIRSGSTSNSLTVFMTVSGTGVAGVDYALLPASITIPAGSTAVDVVITPVDDTEVEGNETVMVTLANNAAYAVGSPASGTVTIWDNDSTTSISSVNVSNVDSKSAQITWLTDVPSDSQVEYGTTTAYGSSTTLDPNMVTRHGVKLNGLKGSTVYHFRVKSRTSAGTTNTSGDYVFKTLLGPPGRLKRK